MPWCLDILLVEHDVQARQTVSELLRGAGHRVYAVVDGMQALATAQVKSFDLVIAGVESRGIDGFTLLSRLRIICPQAHVILASEHPSIEHAVVATNARADYLTKPLTSKNLLGPVASVARRREIRTHVASGSEGDPLVGRSPLIKALRRDVEVVAAGDGVVLITGESGTGKQLVARMLHAASPRSGGPLVELDCAAFDSGALTEEIFGKGGRVEAACGGTLVLDRVEELPRLAQARLVGGLETKGFHGDGRDVRVVAASSADLDALVEAGSLRADLLCRLKELRLDIPPLRRRRDDLPLLVEYFCQKHAPHSRAPRLSPEVWAVLASHHFPGNVRELELAVKHALVHAEGGEIRIEHLPGELRPVWSAQSSGAAATLDVPPLDVAVTAFEHQYLRQALEKTDGNRTRAASLLGISRKSLWAKLKRYEQRHPSLTVAWQR